MKRAWIVAALAGLLPAAAPPAAKAPNIVVILAKDLGYGDWGSYGGTKTPTPALDALAAAGLRFTQFYSAAPIGAASRAALLTGRLPIRCARWSEFHLDLVNDGGQGIAAEEITMAEVLKARGYATAFVGAWMLGHNNPKYVPTLHGFDRFFGIHFPDRDRAGNMASFLGIPVPGGADPKKECLGLMSIAAGKAALELDVDAGTIAARYTEEAVKVIRDNSRKPFFLLVSQEVPGRPSRAKKGGGTYGDALAAFDAGVGSILMALKETGASENTLVLVTADNGPFSSAEASTAPLQGTGGSTWEGGMRVPAIAWWPGKIKPGVTAALASSLDVLPTVAAQAGGGAPPSAIDGFDLSPVLLGKKDGPRKSFYYWRGPDLMAIRKGAWKIHLRPHPEGPWPIHFKPPLSYDGKAPLVDGTPKLFNLEQDPGERNDLAKKHGDIVADLIKEAEAHRAGAKP